MKESSDDPTHVIVTDAALLPRAPIRSWRDYAALAVATCGVGLIPLAPGTWGSLVGVGVYLGLRAVALQVYVLARANGWHVPPLAVVQSNLLLLLLSALALVGVWAATRCEALLKRKDPGAVVIDEVVGQLLTFAFVPVGAGAWTILAGFLAFRVFDIWKPYPIRRLEGLPTGLGIMADDMLAGFYAAVLLSLLTALDLMF